MGLCDELWSKIKELGSVPLPQATTSFQSTQTATVGDQPATQAATITATQTGSQQSSEETCQTCFPERSLKLKLGWTFDPENSPQGTYRFTGMPNPINIPANGEIFLDQNNGTNISPQGNSSILEIHLTDGPVYRFTVFFELPPIHEPTGLKRRLTNLGLYAGSADQYFGGRAMWAIRTFKRIYMNKYQRNATAEENDIVPQSGSVTLTAAFMAAVQSAYGNHPEDNIAEFTIPEAHLNRAETTTTIPNANMFGDITLRRSSYEQAGGTDDQDPREGNQRAVWGGNVNPDLQATLEGYEIYLGVYDQASGEDAIENKLNLPQPVHMLQYALFETGYWLVAGERGNSQTISRFGPEHVVGVTDTATGVFGSLDGFYGRSTHWSVREFQCHAKMPRAAVEDVTTTGANRLYLERLIGKTPATLVGSERYPDDGRVSGSVNQLTARCLQAWLDRQYRCPMIIYASPSTSSLDPATYNAENLWRHNDWDTENPRMYALDFSNYYTIPQRFRNNVAIGSATIQSPITIGYYESDMTGGPLSQRRRHVWTGAESAEVSPESMIGRGGLDGAGLSTAELSTFRVVRTAAHFECEGFLDSINAYDDVGISFGPCHWTLARIIDGQPNERREMGALFSYAENNLNNGFEQAVGRFGMHSDATWPITRNTNGTYTSRVTMQTEGDPVILCGANPSLSENEYIKTWHFFYRMQMACRTIDDWQRAMWNFTRIRIQDILDKEFIITTAGSRRTIRISNYATSEKTVAMLLRWHIIRPAHVYGNRNLLRNALISVSATLTGQALENAVRNAIVGAYSTNNHIQEINGWTNIPQIGFNRYYQLSLTNSTLSANHGSFDFAAP